MHLFPVVICNSFEDFNLAFRLSHNGFQEVIFENFNMHIQLINLNNKSIAILIIMI